MKWLTALLLGAVVAVILPLFFGGQDGLWMNSWTAWGTIRPHHNSPGLLFSIPVFVGASMTTNAEQNRRWWWDNLAGPDSSNFVDADQIKKNNVSQLEVAWTYPYAASGFNPVVVEDVIYTAGYCNNQPQANLPCTGVPTTTNPSMFASRSKHAGGVNAGMVDCSVRFVRTLIDLNTWRGMSTTEGGEVLSDN